MNSDFKKFIIVLFSISLVLFLGFWLLFRTCFSQYYFELLPFISLYFYLLYSVTHYFLMKKGDVAFGKFSAAFMLFTGIKMILNVGIIVAYVYHDKTKAIPFLVVFAVYYIVYTVYEIISLLNYFRKKNEQPPILIS